MLVDHRQFSIIGMLFFWWYIPGYKCSFLCVGEQCVSIASCQRRLRYTFVMKSPELLLEM